MSQGKVLVLNVVGLTLDLLKHAPRLRALAEEGFVSPMTGVLPGVTCTAQATMLTGARADTHGIVGNGWYSRELAEVLFWRQSNHLVGGSKLLDELDPAVTSAKLFWWYNMYSSATWSVTPRPEYPADGRKIPSVYSEPPLLGQNLQQSLGTFPLFNFWGPTASIRSTRWIVEASQKVMNEQNPDLTLVYLPHLDYDLQRLGPNHPNIPEEVQAVDAAAARLIDLAQNTGRHVLVVSEYGITEVEGTVEINRILRQSGLLRVQDTSHGEILDAGASGAFAVADHQVAHVYVREPKELPRVKQLLQNTPGIEHVLGEEQKKGYGLNHPRSGELVVVSERDKFFAYHYWLDEDKAPDFARTVDIHRKPGYDPSELFFDPDRSLLKLQLAAMLLKKKLGQRTLMQAISTRSDLAKGSHGRLPDCPEEAPVFLSSSKDGEGDQIEMTSVKERILNRLRSTASP